MREVDCPAPQVAWAYRRYQIQRNADRSPQPACRYPQLRDPTYLAGRTVDQVCAATGAARSTVLAAYRRLGITVPPSTTQRRGKGIAPPR